MNEKDDIGKTLISLKKNSHNTMTMC